MPPHCDTMDGPVVTAARKAIEQRDVRLILPYVKEAGEREVTAAFEKTLSARNGNPAVNEVADLYFFDTVVRVHRTGEGAPYTGLKPAGLSVGPVIPLCERAIETGDPADLIGLLCDKVTFEVRRRLHAVVERRQAATVNVQAARAYVDAMLGFEVWSHALYGCAERGAHEGSGVEHNHD